MSEDDYKKVFAERLNFYMQKCGKTHKYTILKPQLKLHGIVRILAALMVGKKNCTERKQVNISFMERAAQCQNTLAQQAKTAGWEERK
jgi:hypothetical protein